MDAHLSLHITVWIWITIGAAGIIYAAIRPFSVREVVWWAIAIFLGMAYGGSGLLTLGVAAAGWPSAALFVWRVTAIISVLIGSMILTRVIIAKGRSKADGFNHGPPLWSAIIGTGIMATTAWLSFRASPPKISSDALSSAAPVAATSVLPVASILWLAALVAMGLGIIYFLYLFVRHLEEGGAPQIEAHWGGIGGGLGGWRMSPALGHVLVATLLAVLFTVFLFRFDSQGRLAAAAMPTPTPAPQKAEVNKSQQVESKAEEGKGPP